MEHVQGNCVRIPFARYLKGRLCYGVPAEPQHEGGIRHEPVG